MLQELFESIVINQEKFCVYNFFVENKSFCSIHQFYFQQHKWQFGSKLTIDKCKLFIASQKSNDMTGTDDKIINCVDTLSCTIQLMLQHYGFLNCFLQLEKNIMIDQNYEIRVIRL